MSENNAVLSAADEYDFDDEVAADDDQPRAKKAVVANDREAQDVGGVAGKRLQAFIERIERLEGEKAALMEDMKEVYAEAKGVGFDVKIMRKIISLRKIDAEKRREAEELLELYKSAIGMM